MPQTLSRKVAKNSAINLTGVIITRAGRFLFFLLMARLLGPQDFGFFSIAFSLLLISQTFCESGFYSIFQRFIPVYLAGGEPGKAKGLITFALELPLTLSLVMVAAVCFVPHTWLATLGSNPKITPYIIILFIASPFYLLCELVSYLAMSRNRFVYKSIIYSSRFVLATMAALGLSYWGFKAQSLAWAFTLGALAASILALIFLFRLRADIFGSRRQYETRSWLKFMFPVLVVAVMAVLAGQMDRIFLGMMRSAAEAGIYNAAAKVVSQGNIIYATLAQAFVPLMSELFHARRLDELKELYNRVSWWCLLLCLPLQMVLVVFGREILSIFGHQFQAGYGALLIMTAYPLLLALAGPAGYLLRMANRQQTEALIFTVSAALSIGLNFLLIPRWGMLGAALAFAASASVMAVWNALQLYFYSGIHSLSKGFLGPIILSMALTTLAVELKTWSAPGALVVLFGGYLACLFRFFLDGEDKKILASFSGKLKRLVYAAPILP